MSSDCYSIRIRSVDGADVVLDALTGTAGGCNDYAKSRSFILLLLWEALDLPGAGADADAPLRAALKQVEQENSRWYSDESWMKANVGRFVERSELTERRNNVPEDELYRREREIAEKVGGALYTNEAHVWGPMRWERCHNFTLRARLADAAWGAHLQPGQEFGTTAYDVWWEG